MLVQKDPASRLSSTHRSVLDPRERNAKTERIVFFINIVRANDTANALVNFVIFPHALFKRR